MKHLGLLASALLAFSFCAEAQFLGGSTPARKVVNGACTDGQVPTYSNGRLSGCSSGAGGGYGTMSNNSTAVTQRSILNSVPTTGFSLLFTDDTTRTNVAGLIDESIWATRARVQTGTDIYLTSTGTNTAYVGTVAGNQPTAYSTGQVFFWLVHTASGANPTMNINSLGAKKIYAANGTTQIAANQLAANTVAVLAYDAALEPGACPGPTACGGFRVTNLGGGAVSDLVTNRYQASPINFGGTSGSAPEFSALGTFGGVTHIAPTLTSNTNPSRGYLVLPVAVSGTNYSGFAIQETLPTNWDSNQPTRIRFFANSAGTGNRTYQVATSCVAPGSAIDGALTWNANQDVVVNMPTASVLVVTEITLTMTGCAAGNYLFVKVARPDTVAGSIQLRKVEIDWWVTRS